MARKEHRDARRDLHMGLACADAFHGLAEAMIPSIARDMPEGTFQVTVEFGNLVACAANLGFALEMYLKTLLALKAVDIPTHHNLGQFFDALPEPTRSYLSSAYEDLRTDWLDKPSMVTLAVGALETPAWSDHRTRPMDLRSVLERSRDLFQEWRYVFEVAVPGGEQYQFHEFEYGPLSCAGYAIRSLFPDDALTRRGADR